MKSNTHHLYIHIPFCEEICTYCDFYRTKTKDENIKLKYIEKIINEIKNDNNKYKTIYIGGGTPNFINNNSLSNLLSTLKNKLFDKDYEFTIECNPEFINQSQIDIFKQNKVNRISIGVQTTNNEILKLLKRTHNIQTCINAITLLQKNKFNNISCDFIYNLPLLKISDLKETFNFIKKLKIKHVSFYSLELKEGSILTKQKYHLNTNIEEDQLDFIKNEFDKLNYFRYEISNWASDNMYISKHNLAYWNLSNWKGIGISSYGFENGEYYKYQGTILDWKKETWKWTNQEIFENILIMGLRKSEGIDLSIQKNLDAYNHFKNRLNHELIKIENNHLKAKNFDLLNEILLDII